MPPHRSSRPSPIQAPGSDEPTGRPVLEATAVLGSGSALAALPAPPLSAEGDQLAVTAEAAADGTSAVAARLRAWLPDHLLIWEPTTCAEACAPQAGQGQDSAGAHVRLQSTRRDFGPLTVAANVVSPPGPGEATGDDWALAASIPALPGSVDAEALIRTPGSLPWTDAFVDVSASIPIGDVNATATDRVEAAKPIEQRTTGYKGDAVGTMRTAVPELTLALSNAGRELHVTAQQRGAEVPDDFPSPISSAGGAPCPGHPAACAASRASATPTWRSTWPATVPQCQGAGGRRRRRRDRPTRAPTMPPGWPPSAPMQPVDATVELRLTNITQ